MEGAWGQGLFITVTLLSTSPKHLGASEPGAPKGSLNPPTKEGSKNKNICCNQLFVGPRGCCSLPQAVRGVPLGGGTPGLVSSLPIPAPPA